MQKILLYLAIALLFLGYMYLSELQRQEAMRIYDCVIVQAGLENYAGNPYSRDAWVTFAPLCK